LNAWVRNELRLSAKDANALTRAAGTLDALPAVSEAASAGEIRTDHVAAAGEHHLHHRGMLNITGNAVAGFIFTDHDNRPLLAAHRRRKAIWRENYEIRKVAACVQRRRQHRLTA
jgi:hypothetical protein